MTIHYLAAIHAHREGDQSGCAAKGTKAVTMNGDEITCRTCQHWYWHSEGLQLSEQGRAYVDYLNAAQAAA